MFCRSASVGLWSSVEIPVPETAFPVLSSHASFWLSPDWTMQDAPHDGWRRRLFGPLARDASDPPPSLFARGAWRRMFTASGCRPSQRERAAGVRRLGRKRARNGADDELPTWSSVLTSYAPSRRPTRKPFPSYRRRTPFEPTRHLSAVARCRRGYVACRPSCNKPESRCSSTASDCSSLRRSKPATGDAVQRRLVRADASGAIGCEPCLSQRLGGRAAARPLAGEFAVRRDRTAQRRMART